MKNPKSFKIVEDKEFNEDDEDVTIKSGGVCAVDPELYSILKDLRKKIAKKLELPPYVIFQDISLEAMATTYPITMEELQTIQGVGAGKAKRYGADFLKVIKAHVEENDIERPEDLRVRSVANKSKLKISIIQGIDRKIALDELAESKGLEFDELLDEVEAIVYSGTKINIDYFLDEVMDEDHLDDIFEYFKESESDDLELAINELGGDYTEEEIRLVRIKFISEWATKSMEVVYEDNHLIVVNKAAGEIVQGDKTGDKPLSEMVKDYLREKYNKPGNVFCGVIHRLDRPVSGLVVFAKTSKALARMNEIFQNRKVKKHIGQSQGICRQERKIRWLTI